LVRLDIVRWRDWAKIFGAIGQKYIDVNTGFLEREYARPDASGLEEETFEGLHIPHQNLSIKGARLPAKIQKRLCDLNRCTAARNKGKDGFAVGFSTFAI